MTATAWTVVIVVLAGCGTYAASVLAGHKRACLGRAVAIRALIVITLALIAAVRAGRVLRHPWRHADCLAARIFRPVPGRPVDGEPLDPDEARAFTGIARGWKHPAATERSRT